MIASRNSIKDITTEKDSYRKAIQMEKANGFLLNLRKHVLEHRKARMGNRSWPACDEQVWVMV